MRIARKSAGNVTILALAGEIDANAVRALGEKTDTVVGTGCHRVVFSLGEMKFFNSAVFACLVTASRHLKDVDAELVVSAPSGTLQMMLETLGLTGQVKVFPSDRAALDYFAVERDDVTTPGAWFDTPRPSGSAGAQPTRGIRPCL